MSKAYIAKRGQSIVEAAAQPTSSNSFGKKVLEKYGWSVRSSFLRLILPIHPPPMSA